MNQRKDFVRRAANIRVDSRSSFVDSLLEALRPPLLRDMQNTRQCILSPLKKGALPAIYRIDYSQDVWLFKSFTIDASLWGSSDRTTIIYQQGGNKCGGL
jgi:hypothetical protein